MQDGEEAQLSAEVFRIGTKGEQGFRGGAEQNRVQHVLVVEGEVGDLFGQRKNDVKVFDRQKFGLPAFEPLGACQTLALGAMAVTAGVVGVTRVLTVAVVALFDVAAEGSRAAGLDGAHHFELSERQRVGRTVGLAVLSKNVGHFESGAWHGRYWGGWDGGVLLLSAFFFFAGFASASSGLAVAAMTLLETWT